MNKRKQVQSNALGIAFPRNLHCVGSTLKGKLALIPAGYLVVIQLLVSYREIQQAKRSTP